MLNIARIALRRRPLLRVGSLLRVIGALGDLVEDIVVRLPGPVNVASDTQTHIHRRRGGSAANVAVAVARLGVAARFIGQVGDDAIGAALLETMATDGVDLAVRRHGRTGTIVVFVDQFGERSMLTDRGACGDLDAPDPAWLDGLRVLHVPAYSLVGGALAATAATLIGWSRQRGIIVSIDASSAALIDEVGAVAMCAMLAALRPDVFLCNELETATLGGSEAVRSIAARVTVVKQGAGPSLVLTPDGTTVAVDVPSLDGVVDTTLDTTGAGDAFAAGFLAALTDGTEPVDAASAGHRSARAAIIAVSSPISTT